MAHAGYFDRIIRKSGLLTPFGAMTTQFVIVMPLAHVIFSVALGLLAKLLAERWSSAPAKMAGLSG